MIVTAVVPCICQSIHDLLTHCLSIPKIDTKIDTYLHYFLFAFVFVCDSLIPYDKS